MNVIFDFFNRFLTGDLMFVFSYYKTNVVICYDIYIYGLRKMTQL
jgi:hypothetical protein